MPGHAERKGDGWSDCFGITMPTRPTVTQPTPRGVGTDLAFESPDGVGIRATQYGSGMAVNL